VGVGSISSAQCQLSRAPQPFVDTREGAAAVKTG